MLTNTKVVDGTTNATVDDNDDTNDELVKKVCLMTMAQVVFLNGNNGYDKKMKVIMLYCTSTIHQYLKWNIVYLLFYTMS